MGLCQLFRHEALSAILTAPNSFQSVYLSIFARCCISRIAGVRVGLGAILCAVLVVFVTLMRSTTLRCPAIAFGI